MNDMTIGQFAQAGGVGVETIRYYQRRGLLKVPDTTSQAAHTKAFRRYNADDLKTLRFIRSAQRAGFALSQIEELLELDASQDRRRAREIALGRVAALDAEISALQAARLSLVKLSNACAEGPSGPCPILSAFDH
ncbi:MerR family transcriptional regulator [Henriciella barbarensis]|uniref:MerR family transcriptional regulator n=1 Tax=Henriciella barbarensis TaxID=86342 RepID=A0A399R214_9PROT|nr:MerR family transcriptional regulator [Henriciella barbarensis]RIJ24265.1 MerR family transcriptional regulator [Henriciella barbarensis]